jgi:heat shock protein HtpX
MTNQIKTLVLLGALSAVLVGIGGALGPGMFYLFAALAVAMNVGAYFFSDKLVLRLNGAREVSEHDAPRLHAMVAELAARAGIPKPRVAIVQADYANAFATGRNPARGVVAVTDGLLRLTTDRELRGVLAHEIAHIRNRDILVATIAATMAAAVTYVAHAVQWTALLGGAGPHADEDGPSPLATLALALVAPLAALLIQMGVSRSREFLADDTAARLTGDPEALALALERLSRAAGLSAQQPAPATASLFIVNPLAGAGALLNLLSTHPPMDRRVARLRGLAARGWLAA